MTNPKARAARFETKTACSGATATSLRTLLRQVQADFPDLHFVPGRKFAFRPPRTITLGPEEEFSPLLFLHELGHALSKHRTYQTDVERLKLETEAWTVARQLASQYGVDWDEDVAQGELDTYRDWLHKKSLCPQCGLTRYQTPDGTYHCPQCENFGT